ncbi:RNA polymerase factor sigma-54 [Quisquiliibacterium transsilvanicum]|uniref:RNA polymerase sigma-54 factor n=1 Tax=Quisquiliibacterium transsilvanicum TaxID=1549638 RepID=A0A7W8HJJ2_9BURK|nr:RNA polymerase sigma-54 factor [Quisquiliibacterium transsilvanicum]
MKPSLQLRLNQHLALTPQLQQSIRLLQLSTLELNQELEQALADNPLLERVDDPFSDALRIGPNGAIETQHNGTDAASRDDTISASPESRAEEEALGEGGSTEEWGDADAGDWGSDSGRRSDDENDERSSQQIATTGRTLRDHLAGQLAATQCTDVDRALVGMLMDNLNDDGYLDSSLEELGALLPQELGIEPEALTTALRLLQSFEPAGVGARDLPECLLLQLDARADTAQPPAPRALELARAIARQHLPLLAAKDFTRLRRVLRCDDDELRDAQTLIRQLDPRPGAAFSTDEPTYVVPDVIVRRTRGGWQASLNPDVLPRLRINEAYAQILRRNRGAANGLSSQLQEARWLIKNVQQRYDTIQRVAQAIVERQQAFFSHGEVAMRPLVLREIADTLGLHESTISRVTTQKFMLTPHGTVELKFFFGSHVATDAGGAASSTAIRALIRQLVAAEDPGQPLSDGRLAELLGEQGIVVARRTVAKYREACSIPAVALRKVL